MGISISDYWKLIAAPPSVGVVDGSVGHFPRYLNTASQGPDIHLCLPGFQSLGVNCEGTCWPHHLKGEIPLYAGSLQVYIFEQIGPGLGGLPS